MKKLIVLAALSPQFACAATGYYLVSTYDVEGQRSIDYKYWNADYKHSSSTSSPEIGYGYGVTSRWYTELYAVWRRPHGRDSKLAGVAWQNDYLLTQGQYPFDLALHTDIQRSPGNGYGAEIGPVLQTEYHRTQFNFNLFLQRDFRNGRSNDTEMVYQWQVKQRWKSWLEPGLQGFGELGKWNDWLPRSRQSHRAGPALFGARDLGRGQAVKYEAAWLIGKNSARAAKSFTMRVQYLF
ncbi:hypothetical protein [Pseudoduganella namucuonensis]|uniref:Uncharacterized protein n=1 Tax=Pseudoduganella namucuonensis TaxID=1035707 RepID=A0A1I7JMC3_9BURK|nr:hypothetical protein [Pseudoduganella namucuonensis]SFU86280.1 hypothetical protein SAMN05216552_101248 [Pseudoduganella namucuonensis]